MVLLSDPGKFVPRLVANNHQTNIKNRRPYSTHYRQTIPEQRDRLANRLRVRLRGSFRQAEGRWGSPLSLSR